MFGRIFYHLVILFLFSISILTGCNEDEPLQPQEEHFEAIGVFIHNAGVEVVSILRGETDDTLIVQVNNQSDLLSVLFYNDNEEIINPPSSGQALGFEIDNTTIAEINQETAGSFEFRISGKQKGNTHLELFLLHEGHADFRSGKIPVRVE